MIHMDIREMTSDAQIEVAFYVVSQRIFPGDIVLGILEIRIENMPDVDSIDAEAIIVFINAMWDISILSQSNSFTANLRHTNKTSTHQRFAPPTSSSSCNKAGAHQRSYPQPLVAPSRPSWPCASPSSPTPSPQPSPASSSLRVPFPSEVA